MLQSKWIWPASAAAAAMIVSCSVIAQRITEPLYSLPEEAVSSGIVFAEEMQVHLPLAENNVSAEQSSLQGQEPVFVIRLDGDTLRVYREGEREPDAVYELPAGWLPDYDRILLEYGMKVNGEEELREMIEDYIS